MHVTENGIELKAYVDFESNVITIRESNIQDLKVNTIKQQIFMGLEVM